MTKILTFKKRKDFLRVASGFHIATYNVVLQATRSLFNDNQIHVGYTATKKIGNAVLRSKAKRRLRAAVREILPSNHLSFVDYVFIARNSTPSCDYKDLTRDIAYALKKIHKNFQTTTEDDATSLKEENTDV
jgi:ribonuclease P protein component